MVEALAIIRPQNWCRVLTEPFNYPSTTEFPCAGVTRFASEVDERMPHG